jgi:hypothetical protein
MYLGEAAKAWVLITRPPGRQTAVLGAGQIHQLGLDLEQGHQRLAQGAQRLHHRAVWTMRQDATVETRGEGDIHPLIPPAGA